MLGECFGLRKIGEVFVISVHLHRGGNSFKIVSLLLEEFDDG